MSLSAKAIAALAEELQALVPSRVDDVFVPAERTVVLSLFGGGEKALLLLSADADLCRIHVARERPSQPANPFALQMLLRRELAGAQLQALTAEGGDRVVRLSFRTREGPRAIAAELTGRNGNLFWLDGEGTILASAAANLSQRRELVRGKPWVPPAPHSGDPGDVPAPLAGERFPLSAAVEAHYRDKALSAALTEARRRLREPVKAAAARARRAREKLLAEAERIPRAEDDRRHADLLKAALHSLVRGAASAKLTEWTAEGPREVVVPLDPALGPKENMERYYRRYKRITESAGRVRARAAEIEAKLAALMALSAQIEAAETPEALARLEPAARKLDAAPRREAQPRRRKKDEPLPPYRTFVSLRGGRILVGRNAAANDELTKKVAKGNDLWLHARGLPGSHVVVPLPKGAAPDQETLLDAAHLAAHFSDGRGEPSCEVAWTRAKHVTKKKGAAPGAVNVSQEKTLLLRLEPARLERLLASEEEEAP